MGSVVIAAPASGSGKTLITLGLLRALKRQGVQVSSLKVGPDYIDPQFHHLASGRTCGNLDAWGMRPETLRSQVAQAQEGASLTIVEGVMGLFDGAKSGDGSTADIAAKFNWPVVLVIDVRGQAASAAAVVEGFANFREDVHITGVIFNRVGSPEHASTLRSAMRNSTIPILGCIPRNKGLSLPERHLGLVQASESVETEDRINAVATYLEEHLDLELFCELAKETKVFQAASALTTIPPLGNRIAIAQDDAFSFSYAYQIESWRRAGADVIFFSPLNDKAPDEGADGIFLPGGYPELYAERLASNHNFMSGVRAAAKRGANIYGECGGYMVLGKSLIDHQGKSHSMIDLLPVETSFNNRRLHLGYRAVTCIDNGPLGKAGNTFRGHEFHYSRIIREDSSAPLFQVKNALGEKLPQAGCRSNFVMGSFIHLIDCQATS
jgi:cobyrinic acid a,c-diamide synthase